VLTLSNFDGVDASLLRCAADDKTRRKLRSRVVINFAGNFPSA
jgi:hypothetical protein